ncbi:tripartite tricarboxylate transporter substrate binding protein [Bradyrhizobium sp. LHD-71]|uniref:Bug family tripartite tricarboxylate transporter substrate binding protein n=1 Tax=Bradyrhizobium sp. LHD-71 TaxID=3072141 RepID=UPI002810828D|nr:tripartite tricarboxylate transporter substrate binding protein [Bradyrhizobium sp. LHD-71]MDQ8732433.1 tripartite tricarboxylate transporter substrate binding protein [Bradyrhizobium sp. LHD-71]
MRTRLDRRTFLAGSAAAATLPGLGVRARAQGTAYPNKPIKIVVGYPAGGQTDIIGRTYGDYVGRQLGQPVVVDIKAGAGGIIGAVEVKRAAPDGYTLMCTISTTMVQNRVTVKNLPYDADKDFALISLLSQVGLVMVASEKTGAKTLQEFVAYAKKADKVSMGTYAAGSTAHLIIVELNKQYGLNIEAVHYRGEAPMWTDIAGQTLDAAIGSYNAALGTLQSGRGKPIGATGLQRLSALPDTPTLVQQGAKSRLYDLVGFTCFAAPTGTPIEIIKKLSDTIVAGASDAKVQETLATFNLNPPVPYQQAQKLFAEQTPLWVEFMQGVGMKPE